MRTIGKSAVVLALLVACGGPVACSSSGDDAAKPQDLAARLEQDTGVPWSVYDDDQAKAVRFLAPKTPVKTSGATPEEAARAFFERYRDGMHGGDAADELRLVAKNDAITTEDDGPYLRFAHYLAGTDARIFDVVSTARFTTDGALMWLQSGFRGGLGAVPRTAVISGPDAATKATAKSNELCGRPAGADDASPTSTLGVSLEGGAPRLVWRVQIMRSTGSCATPLVTVDATTGEMIGVRDGLEPLWDDSPGVRYEALGDKTNIRRIDITSQTFSPLSGKYLMLTESFPKVNTSNYGTILNSEITTDTLGSWDTSSPARGAAVDAHFNVMHALRYFKENHNRNSTTGLGNAINVVMHYPFKRPDGTVYGSNAANDARLWIINQMLCGDGDYLTGGDILPVCSGLDVTAHEIAHGVTHYTSGLVYRGESGALNEAFSDVMGASAENALEVDDPARNFLIGERIFKSGTGFRDMQNPSRNRFPDHYDSVKTCAMSSDDSCGVHSNSGIANRAFSLMTAGGVHRTSKIAVAKGIGWKPARELWYDTLTKLAPDADFKTAALAQVTESIKRGPEVFQAVACAWYAVGAVKLDVHPALVGLLCPAPAAPGAMPRPTTPDCQGRDNGWFCSDNVKNSAIHCKGGAADTGAFCADPDQTCKKAAVDDWTATVSAAGEVSCQ
ncbi:MAG: Zinc metalloproteinase precursor [Labilithrix sp.]|nr:Zinc metalloproteinase precursor [Labilithrix sp.]